MKQSIQIGVAPLFKSKAVIIKCGLIVVERTSVRPKFGDVLRREIEELSTPPFALPGRLVRGACSVTSIKVPTNSTTLPFSLRMGCPDTCGCLTAPSDKNNAVVCFIVCFLDLRRFESC